MAIEALRRAGNEALLRRAVEMTRVLEEEEKFQNAYAVGVERCMQNAAATKTVAALATAVERGVEQPMMALPPDLVYQHATSATPVSYNSSAAKQTKSLLLNKKFFKILL